MATMNLKYADISINRQYAMNFIYPRHFMTNVKTSKTQRYIMKIDDKLCVILKVIHVCSYYVRPRFPRWGSTHFSQRKSLIFNSYPNSPFKLNYVYKQPNKDHHLLGTKVKYSLISREIFLLVNIHLATEHCLMVAILITGGLGDTRESMSIIQIYPSHQCSQ